MRLFYFILDTGRWCVADPEGQELANEIAARHHAMAVAREMMRHREDETRLWQIRVCDDYLNPLFDVFFAQVDEPMAGYPRDLRISIKRVARTVAAFKHAFFDTQVTLKQQLRETLAHADRILNAFNRGRDNSGGRVPR